MTTTEIDPDFSRAVRAELTAIGTKRSGLQRHQRRARGLVLVVGAVALAATTTGAAVVVNSLPGTTTVAPLGQLVTVTNTGTASIDLGLAPAHAAAVVIDVSCVSDTGTISVPTNPQTDGGAELAGSVEWDCALVHTPTRIDDGLLPADGSTSLTVTADAGTTWKATAQYATSTTTPWGVNANGQTYGVPNTHGEPDLTAAQATNGRQGYIFVKDLMSMDHDGYINVYASDGTNIIGKFPIGDVDDHDTTSN